MKTLEEARKAWNRKPVLVSYIDRHLGAVIDIGEGFDSTAENPLYSVYRFFQIGDSWHVSADKDSVPLKELLEHLAYQLGDIQAAP